MTVQTYILPLLIGWFLDFLLGDPQWMPHPVVWFGKMISFGEKHLNKGKQRKLKGALLSLFFVTFVFVVTWALLYMASLLAGNFDFSLLWKHTMVNTAQTMNTIMPSTAAIL